MNFFKNTEYRAFPCGFLNRARKPVSAPAVFQAVGSLDGIVDAKASKIKRLRTESDEATINVAVFLSGALSVSPMRLRNGERVMESGLDSRLQWSRNRFQKSAALVIVS